MLMERMEYRLQVYVDYRINIAAGTRPSTHGALAPTGLGASPLSIVELRLLSHVMATTSLTWGTAL